MGSTLATILFDALLVGTLLVVGGVTLRDEINILRWGRK